MRNPCIRNEKVVEGDCCALLLGRIRTDPSRNDVAQHNQLTANTGLQLFLARPGQYTELWRGPQDIDLNRFMALMAFEVIWWLETFIGITSSIVARPATAATLHIILNSLHTWCIYSVYGSAPPKAPPLPIADRPSRSVRRVSTGHYVIFTDGQPKKEREFYLILEGRRGIFLWVPPPSFSPQLTSVCPSVCTVWSVPISGERFFLWSRPRRNYNLYRMWTF
jgi:hypothetical protein